MKHKTAPATPEQGFYGFMVIDDTVKVVAEAAGKTWKGHTAVTFMRPDFTQLPGLYLTRDAAIALRESLTDALGLTR